MPVVLPSESVAPGRCVGLQDSAGLGVEDRDRLRGTHLKDGGGVIAGGVQRDGLGAGRGAEIDLGAGGRDDRAITDHPRVGQGLRVGRAGARGRVLAGVVRRERHGLSRGKRRKAQPRRQQAGEQKQTLDQRIISKAFSGHIRFSSLNLWQRLGAP